MTARLRSRNSAKVGATWEPGGARGFHETNRDFLTLKRSRRVLRPPPWPPDAGPKFGPGRVPLKVGALGQTQRLFASAPGGQPEPCGGRTAAILLLGRWTGAGKVSEGVAWRRPRPDFHRLPTRPSRRRKVRPQRLLLGGLRCSRPVAPITPVDIAGLEGAEGDPLANLAPGKVAASTRPSLLRDGRR